MKQSFEQLPKEGAKAYAAFAVYRDMGSERSLEAVRVKCGKSARLIQRWSSRWRWAERVQEHEAHLSAVEMEATERLTRGKAVERVARREKILEREWEMHEKCLAAAQAGLERFLAKADRGASLAEIARILETASKLGRLATGMPTDRTEVAEERTVRVEVSVALEKIYGNPLPGEVIDAEEVNGQKAEDRGRKAEVRDQKSEVGKPGQVGVATKEEKV